MDIVDLMKLFSMSTLDMVSYGFILLSLLSSPLWYYIARIMVPTIQKVVTEDVRIWARMSLLIWIIPFVNTIILPPLFAICHMPAFLMWWVYLFEIYYWTKIIFRQNIQNYSINLWKFIATYIVIVWIYLSIITFIFSFFWLRFMFHGM